MRHRAAIATLAAAVGAAVAPAGALGAPSLSDGTVSPSGWSNAPHALVGWTQSDFGIGLPTAATVEVNLAPDGSESGAWQPRFVAPAPLLSGPNFPPFPGIPVGDLEGRHAVRVVVPGVAGSPLALGTLQLDRTPPVVDGVRSMADPGGRWTFAFEHVDALSGIHPSEPVVAEMNTSPAADEAGIWLPLESQPAPGDALPGKFASHPLPGMAPGVYRARVRSVDRAGNAGVSPLGVIDQEPPRVTDVRTVKPPTHTDRVAHIAFTVADGAGVGVDPGEIAYAYLKGGSAYIGFATVAEGVVSVSLPEAGDHEVVIRVPDAARNLGESAPVAVPARYHEGRPAVPASVRREPVPLFRPRIHPPQSRGTRWAVRTVRRFHARRGVRLTARVLAARTGAEWRTLLGTAQAGRHDGYTTFDDQVLLGPDVTAGLARLHRARMRAARRPRAPLPSRARLDEMAHALAVLLHETLHATGPRSREDFRLTRSGRAFEEGFTEAATVDLLPRYVRSLGGSPRLARALRRAAARYQPDYRRQVGRARALSAIATSRPAASAEARRWRVMVADTWGEDRWVLLEQAAFDPEARLRRLFVNPPGPPRRR